MIDGPSTVKTNSLTYAECVLAVRRGVLPDGTELEAELHGYVGRALVLAIAGGEAAALECANTMQCKAPPRNAADREYRPGDCL